MKKIISKKLNYLIILIISLVFLFDVKMYAENISIHFTFGLQNVAKSGIGLPVKLTVENKDSQDFSGHIDLSVPESNDSVYVYRDFINIPARSEVESNFNISINNTSNTITIEAFNKREDVVANERMNIDLSVNFDKIITGAFTSDYNSLSYIDKLLFMENSLELKLVELTNDINDLSQNLDILDMLILSDYDVRGLSNELINSIQKFAETGKPIIFASEKEKMSFNNIANARIFEDWYNDSKYLTENASDKDIRVFTNNNMNVIFLPFSLNTLYDKRDNSKTFQDIIDNTVNKNFFYKLSSAKDSIINNDYYSISNLLNVVDKQKIPDIFFLTTLLIVYLSILIIIIYAYLRNQNLKKYYGRYALVFSIIYTIIMFAIGFPAMKKNVFLTYISIVDINNANAKEKAFLNFRTSESIDYNIDTSKNINIFPIIRDVKDSLSALSSFDEKQIKTTTFLENDDSKSISVINTKSFESNLFFYENSNYLNDIYNIASSYQRFDGQVTGRITNNMNLTLKNTHLLLYGKILRIGDIEPNHSISLSRAKTYGAPINNNEMLADILANEIDHNIIKYYLDENVSGYFNYGLLFAFIDDNGTIDLKSSNVGDVYGRTLIVTKVFDDKMTGIADYCTLQNDVVNVEGNYEALNNTIRGDEDIVNEYSFDTNLLISKIYFENIDNFEYSNIDSYVPFYGNIYAYNNITNNFDLIDENRIVYDELTKYLSKNNKIVIKFNPTSRDPLYRKISLPIIRAVASY